MAYRNKTYVCFDGDEDMHYYLLMQAWKQNDGIKFNFFNAHDLNSARDTSLTESIRRQLKERLKNSNVLVVLIGEKTKNLYRFVRWEMEQAIDLGLPIIAVNLNGKRKLDDERCPPVIRNELAMHISFNAAIMQYALEHWIAEHVSHVSKNETGPYFYNNDVYARLGL
jgi:hypothetical protein